MSYLTRNATNALVQYQSIHEFFIMEYYDLISITSDELLKRVIDREMKMYHCSRPVTYSNASPPSASLSRKLLGLSTTEALVVPFFSRTSRRLSLSHLSFDLRPNLLLLDCTEPQYGHYTFSCQTHIF